MILIGGKKKKIEVDINQILPKNWLKNY